MTNYGRAVELLTSTPLSGRTLHPQQAEEVVQILVDGGVLGVQDLPQPDTIDTDGTHQWAVFGNEAVWTLPGSGVIFESRETDGYSPQEIREYAYALLAAVECSEAQK